MTSRQHGIVSTARVSPSSDGETLAPLAPTRREDGTAGAGTHPQAEAVGLVTPTVVGLERALHRSLPIDVEHSRVPAFGDTMHPRHSDTRGALRRSCPWAYGNRREYGTVTDPRYGGAGHSVKPTGEPGTACRWIPPRSGWGNDCGSPTSSWTRLSLFSDRRAPCAL